MRLAEELTSEPAREAELGLEERVSRSKLFDRVCHILRRDADPLLLRLSDEGAVASYEYQRSLFSSLAVEVRR